MTLEFNVFNICKHPSTDTEVNGVNLFEEVYIDDNIISLYISSPLDMSLVIDI